MGNLCSLTDFTHEPETELYKIYFSNLNILRDNNNKIEIMIPNGNSCNEISSITYYLQFISNGIVIDEISLTCNYGKNNRVKIKLRKHIKNNLENTHEVKEKYELKRVGFPINEYILESNPSIIFEKIDLNTFIISLSETANIKRTIGILNLKTTKIVTIEPVVKTIIKIRKSLKPIKFNDITFMLYAPKINNNILKLTDQYNIFVSFDLEKNIINVFDNGVQKICFKERTSILPSLKSLPRTKIIVSEDFSIIDNSFIYIFSKHQQTF